MLVIILSGKSKYFVLKFNNKRYISSKGDYEMLSSRELCAHMKECLKDIDEFSTRQLKDLLKSNGVIYKEHYGIAAFSNAIATLQRESIICSSKNGRGWYRVISDNMNTERKVDRSSNIVISDEKELEEIRNKIALLLKDTHVQIEELLDSVKSSDYVKNPYTYNDIIRLLKYLETFNFTVKRDL